MHVRFVFIWAFLAVFSAGIDSQQARAADAVVDDREASFMPPPASLLVVPKPQPLPETKDGQAKASEAKAIEPKPIEPKPVEAKPVEAKPSEVKPVEAKPIETKAIEPKPVEAKPVEVKEVKQAPDLPKEDKTVPKADAAVTKQEVKEEKKTDAQTITPQPIEPKKEATPPTALLPKPAEPAPVVKPVADKIEVQPIPVITPPAKEPEAKASEEVKTEKKDSVVETPKEGEAKALPAVELPTDMAAANTDAESLGLLAPSNGGLGAALWKGTSRKMLERMLPALALPSSSLTLNDLARRMLLTTSQAPAAEGAEKPARNLVTLRVEALIGLGAVADAWKLAALAGPGWVEPETLRKLTEATLVNADSKAVCDRIPGLMQTHAKSEASGVEWQKSLLICQLRANDMKAVQLSIDLMRDQKGVDAVFLSLISKNVLGGSKQLPRQLTPLRAPQLAALRQLSMPLPPELYARPEAVLIPELLLAKASDERAKLTLAERSAAKGILSPEQLADVFKSVEVTDQDMVSEGRTLEPTPRTRAIAYQAAVNEQGAQKKIELVQRILGGAEVSALTGNQMKLAAELLDTVPVIAEYQLSAPVIARFFALSGNPEKALAWVNLAKQIASRLPDVNNQLNANWPLYALSGIVPDGDYAAGMKGWLEVAMATPAGAEASVVAAQKDRVSKTLLLLNVLGYAVPEEAWLNVIDASSPVKQAMPPALLIERLRQAAMAGRRGEVILLSLQLCGGSVADTPFIVMLEVIRALKQVELTAEAQALARDVWVGLGW